MRNERQAWEKDPSGENLGQPVGDRSWPAGPWRHSHTLAVVTSFITCACMALHVSHLPHGPCSGVRPPSLPEVPRGRAVDGLLLPEGLQPLRPGGHHPLSFFFGRHFRTKTDLRGEDFKSTEVQRAVLQPQREERGERLPTAQSPEGKRVQLTARGSCLQGVQRTSPTTGEPRMRGLPWNLRTWPLLGGRECWVALTDMAL